jgi:hypothetical protein
VLSYRVLQRQRFLKKKIKNIVDRQDNKQVEAEQCTIMFSSQTDREREIDS